MKFLLLLVGALMVLIGIIKGANYAADYAVLTPYGKGIVWGSLVLVVLGSTIIFLGLRRKS